MTIVTGDRYLDLLSTFIEENTSLLLDGVLVLKLNPVGLHYLQTRLEALEELEALRVGAPVDYLRAYVADLGDHRALEQLRRVLRLLTSVKVVGTVEAPARDPTPITLLPFSRLRFLELRGCDLSTSAARGLLELRPILEKLVCYNSADALRHIFSERSKEIQGAPVWSRLADVSCFGNGMLLMDESLQLLPAVVALDLSRNRFAKLANLQKCSKLKYLDAGFNNITTLEKLNKILHCVTKLVLRNNAVISTRGLHRISSLEALDLSYNLISNFREVELLGELPALRFLWLEGNPITFSTSYRREALSYFPEPTKLVLDGQQTSMWESFAARRIVARRLKQRTKYGAFTPAQTCESSSQPSDSEKLDDDTSNRAESSNGAGSNLSSYAARSRKKSSRLASIIDVTAQKASPRIVESPRQSSLTSLASLESAPAHSVSESKEQIEEAVQDLIQRAEVLKRGGSPSWLKDLNVLLESEGKGKGKAPAQETDDSSKQSLWQKRRKRRSSRKAIVGESISLKGKNKDGEREDLGSRQGSARLGKDIRGSSYDVDDKYLKSLRTSSSLTDRQGSLVDGDEQPSSSARTPTSSDGGSGLKLVDTAEKFRLAEELLTGKTLVSSSSSPPQFNQALLHRRQTLERELLLLPSERDAISPSDSDTSSGTIYSHFSDSSNSPYHSPSSVWQPYRFDNRNLELSSTQGERSDSESTCQSSSTTEAQEGEALERIGTDVEALAPTAETAGEDSIPIARHRETTEPAVSLTPTVHSAEGKDSCGRVTTAEVHPVQDGNEGTKPDGIHSAEDLSKEDKETSGEDSRVFIDSQQPKKAEGAEIVQCAPPLFEGNVGRGKENMGTNEDKLSPRVSRVKPKPSRRIVHLESLGGVPESSVLTRPSTREIHELVNELHRASSLGGDRVSGQVLERSLSSSVQYGNPFRITRSSSADATMEQVEWSRKRSQEDVLASTSLQQVDSPEAADSGLQFHRVHHLTGPFVGQCA